MLARTWQRHRVASASVHPKHVVTERDQSGRRAWVACDYPSSSGRVLKRGAHRFAVVPEELQRPGTEGFLCQLCALNPI